MRRVFICTLALAAMFALYTACDKQKPDPDPLPPEEPSGPEEPQEPQGPQAGVYYFVASALKERWNEGDQIYVHGKMGYQAESVTLSKADISEDGKTATALLSQAMGIPMEPDGLYAAWPESAVKHSVAKLGSKTSFSSCNGLLSAAYLDGDTFRFTDVSSCLSFSVSGGFDGYALSAGNRDGLDVTNYEVDYTSAGISFNIKDNSGYPFRYGSIADGEKTVIWLPSSLTFKGGLSIHLEKDGQWTSVFTLPGDITLKSGESLDLGDISSSITAWEGPDPVMPVMGERTVFNVDFNELSGLCLSADGEFFWSVGDDGELARLSLEGKVIEKRWVGCDLEAVSLDPRTGDLFVGVEDLFNPVGTDEKTYSYNGVGIIRAPEFEKPEALFRISAAKNYGNDGIEGVTYYKDGLIYAGAQANSHLFLCNPDTGEVIWDKRLRDKGNFPAITEIADLCYDPLTDWLWIIDSEARKIFVLTGDASSLLGAYPVSGIDNPESVCVDHARGCVWVGDDYGSTSHLYRYEFEGL